MITVVAERRHSGAPLGYWIARNALFSIFWSHRQHRLMAAGDHLQRASLRRVGFDSRRFQRRVAPSRLFKHPGSPSESAVRRFHVLAFPAGGRRSPADRFSSSVRTISRPGASQNIVPASSTYLIQRIGTVSPGRNEGLFPRLGSIAQAVDNSNIRITPADQNG